ncbi:MAG: hypothetical protein AMXMBFR84_30250 [Candidatus Hydrogenedentota bacterium]
MNKRFTGLLAVCAALVATAGFYIGSGGFSLGWSTPVASAGDNTAESSPAAEPDHVSENASMIKVRVIGQDGQLTQAVELPKLILSDEEWKSRLTPDQFMILRAKGTERPFCGTLLDNKKEGYYLCVGCKLPLFQSGQKFNSGTGWPSFYAPVAEENITEISDSSHGMIRTEILCARCDGHLGHVFEDGPPPTGLRYCLNSESLTFVDQADAKSAAEVIPASVTESKPDKPKVGGRLPAPEKDTALAAATGKNRAVFAGGCFWCTEAVFEDIDGVYEVVSGYTGGEASTANYKAVCNGDTGHAEAIRIEYDPAKVTFGQLLRIFFATHNPTTLNRQGPDSGTQYRSAIFFADEEQKAVADAYIKQLTAAGSFSKPIVTTLEPLTEFYDAEEYHQDFAKVNPAHPYVQMWAMPKLEKLKEAFAEHMKEE